MSYFRKVLEWTVLHCPYINQKVAVAALDGPQDWLVEVFTQFETRRNQLLDGIRDVETFSWVTPQGGPFIFLNHSRNHGAEPGQFDQHLLRRYGVPAVGGRYFKNFDHVRIPFGGSQEALNKLIVALTAADKQGR